MRYRTRKAPSKVKNIIVVFFLCLLTALGALIFFGTRWMLNNFAHIRFAAFLSTVMNDLNGTNTDVVKDGLLKIAGPSVIITLGVLVALCLNIKKARKAVVLCVVSFSLAMGCVGFARFDHALGVTDYALGQLIGSSFIEDHYVSPNDVAITFPQAKRNLIYIYMESMETSFADEDTGGGSEYNYIPELTKLSQTYEDFSGTNDTINGAYPTEFTTWTLAGMFAQTTGLPYKTTALYNINTSASFFPTVKALGDVLEDEGYNQTFLLGSDATFARRDLYFTDHGHYAIKDYTYAKDAGWIDEDYKVWWGYEDQKLYANAKTELKDLASQDAPFNLTMLTVDTHTKDGYRCALCEDKYDGQYANVLACASKQVADFVAWIQKQDFYENTTIIIAGDHCTMDADFGAEIDDDCTRKAVSIVINGAAERETTTARTFTTLDAYPTTLAALGATIEGNRLGLGVNLYSSGKTLAEELGYEEMDDEFIKKSTFMNKLAKAGGTVKKLQRSGELPTVEFTLERVESTTTANLSVKVTNGCDTSKGSFMIFGSSSYKGLRGRSTDMTTTDNETYTCTVDYASYGASGTYYFVVYYVAEDGVKYRVNSCEWDRSASSSS